MLNNTCQTFLRLYFYKYLKYSPDVSLDLQVEAFKMLYDKAIPIGLILNELISNSFLHAFPDAEKGNIKIQMYKDKSRKSRVNFIYSDSGGGFPDDLSFENDGNSLGTKIITSLAEGQLRGILDIKNKDGYICKLEFDI